MSKSTMWIIIVAILLCILAAMLVIMAIPTFGQEPTPIPTPARDLTPQRPTGMDLYGFDDFTYDGVHYDNPARDIALSMDGNVVTSDWDAVESLQLSGPGLGIGLDVSIDGAYINGSAFGLRSLAADGPDAGDYECGHLYARLLEAHPCSLFVHVPLEPTTSDLAVVEQAITKVYQCQLARGGDV